MSPTEWKYDATPGLELFSTSRWNVVLLDGAEASPRAAEALTQLCRIYGFPLYAYLRRLSYSPQDAHALAEAFFARLLAKSVGAARDGGKNKFRSFVLASLHQFLAYERDAAKEAGGQVPVSIEARDAECRYLQEGMLDLSPERTFERHWAIAVLERALVRLRLEHARAGNSQHFEALKKFLTSPANDKAYVGAAEELKLSAASLEVSVQRMQQRYRELVRAEIADVVAGTSDIDDETRWLVAALS